MKRFVSSWLRIERPDDRRAVWRVHGPWALLAGIVWAVSFLVPFETPLRVCGFLRLTGFACIFCGYTRSFSAISQGAWHFAWTNAPAAILLYAGLLLVLVWNGGALVSKRLILPGELWGGRRGWKWVLAVGAVVLLANWVYRLHLGLR